MSNIAMKDLFPGYYRLDTTQVAALWKECTFVFDANVLLNLYRWPKQARDDLLGVLELVSDRLWLPYQAALEYQENRLTVIAEQLARFGKARDVVEKSRRELHGRLDELQLERRHSAIKPAEMLHKVDSAISEFLTDLDALERAQPGVTDEDQVRVVLDKVFAGKVGAPPRSQQDLDKIYLEGKTRYEQKIPPGYMDAGKAKDERSAYVCGALTFKREYGDLVLWHQIKEELKNKSIEKLILVTDDEKEDWWWSVDSKGTKTIGPRPELVSEIMTGTKVSVFNMYNSERFLKYAKEYVGARVEKVSVEQVREVAQLDRSKTTTRMPWDMRVHGAIRAVYAWAKETYPEAEISWARMGDGCDFVVTDTDSARVGYEVKLLRDLSSVWLDYAASHLKRALSGRKMDRVALVVAVPSDDYDYDRIKHQIRDGFSKRDIEFSFELVLGRVDPDPDDKNELSYVFVEEDSEVVLPSKPPIEGDP